MEKLKLKALQLGVKEMLTKEQMKKITGGTGCHNGSCQAAVGAGLCGGDGIHIPCQCIVFGVAYPDPACYAN